MTTEWGGQARRTQPWWMALVALGAFVYSAAVAAQPPTLRIGYVEFPPYEYQDEQGQAAGSFIDLTRLVAQEAGYQPEFIHLPISRLYLYLREGRIDLWPGLTNIPMLQGRVLASGSTPLFIELSAWHHKDMPPILNFSDLHNRRLILISGYTYSGLAKYLSQQEDIDLTYTSTHRSAVDMLRRNRGDYLLDYRAPIEALGLMEPINDLKHSFIRERMAAWLFSLEDEAAERFRTDFDAAFERLRTQDRLPLREQRGGAQALPGFPELSSDSMPGDGAFGQGFGRGLEVFAE